MGKFKFDITEGVILCKAKITNKRQSLFLKLAVDTGASFIMISIELRMAKETDINTYCLPGVRTSSLCGPKNGDSASCNPIVWTNGHTRYLDKPCFSKYFLTGPSSAQINALNWSGPKDISKYGIASAPKYYDIISITSMENN